MCAVFLVVTIEMTFSSMNGEALGGCHGGHSLGIGGNSERPGYQPIDGHGEDEMNGGIGGEGRGFGAGVGRLNGNITGSLSVSGEEMDALDEIASKRRGSRHRRSGSIAGGLRSLERLVMLTHPHGESQFINPICLSLQRKHLPWPPQPT